MRKNSLAITLLLAAIVPLVTGCHDRKEACERANAQEWKALDIADTLWTVRQTHEINLGTCERLKGELRQIHRAQGEAYQAYCHDHYNGRYCEFSTRIGVSAKNAATLMDEACDYISQGGTNPWYGYPKPQGAREVAPSGTQTRSTLTQQALTEVIETFDRVKPHGEEMLDDVCGPGVANQVQLEFYNWKFHAQGSLVPPAPPQAAPPVTDRRLAPPTPQPAPAPAPHLPPQSPSQAGSAEIQL